MSTKTRDLRIGELRVAAAMHAGVHTCDREAPLSEVAATMARELIHCVVVESGSGESGPPWGIVSDLDLVAAAMVRAGGSLDERLDAGREELIRIWLPLMFSAEPGGSEEALLRKLIDAAFTEEIAS